MVLLKKRVNLVRNDILIISFLIFQFFCNLLANILQIERINNQFLYHINCLISYILIERYFHYLLKTSLLRRMIFIFSILFVVLFFLNIVFLQTVKEFNSNSYSICACLISFFSVVFFKQCLVYFSEYNIFQIREVWYSSGILVYFASSFFVFISYSYFSYFNVKSIPFLWKMHNFFLFVMCILISKGFLCRDSIRKYS